MRTVGHGTASAEMFTALLAGVGVGLVVDVRRFPGSRRYPHFGREQMEGWLGAGGIGYRWLEGLGGRRRGAASSPNHGLRSPQFRAYADHMASAEFARSVDELLDAAATSPTAVMCSESVWWRCHRRLLADHLVLIEGVHVAHVLHDGRITDHPVTACARAAGRHVLYDVVETRSTRYDG